MTDQQNPEQQNPEQQNPEQQDPEQQDPGQTPAPGTTAPAPVTLEAALERITALETALADVLADAGTAAAVVEGPAVRYVAYDEALQRYVDGGTYTSRTAARAAAKDQGIKDFTIREV